MIHLQEVRGAVLEVRQRQRVLLVHVAVGLRFQEGALIVGVGHREEGVGVAHELVDIPLASHLQAERASEARNERLGQAGTGIAPPVAGQDRGVMLGMATPGWARGHLPSA